MYGNGVLRSRGEDGVDCIGVGAAGLELKPCERAWSKYDLKPSSIKFAWFAHIHAYS